AQEAGIGSSLGEFAIVQQCDEYPASAKIDHCSLTVKGGTAPRVGNLQPTAPIDLDDARSGVNLSFNFHRQMKPVSVGIGGKGYFVSHHRNRDDNSKPDRSPFQASCCTPCHAQASPLNSNIPCHASRLRPRPTTPRAPPSRYPRCRYGRRIPSA